MSRGEQLRAKFKAKGESIANDLNSHAGKFQSELFGFVLKECQAMSKPEFADLMFEKYKADQPVDRYAWFQRNVTSLFKSVTTPPNWVLEPDWCYHDGMPMEFLHQFQDEHGLSFYVFRGRQDYVRDDKIIGAKMFYKVCAQSLDGTVLFDANMIA